MLSSRLILIFLGIIFLIIVILSSSRIAGSLRQRFGSFIPTIRQSAETTPTPTPFEETGTPTPTFYFKITGTPANQIPATGPADLLWLTLGGCLIAGLSLRKFTTSSK
ncbi:hypothetical protein A2960_06045 [Candidatus Gottesmanbacteria bacterium RIFCSPLOWO2_01_FULL_39_12b]|uniref:Uncharacterized protein n=1 Tax=Candidatus Gottesmanbacteria bacterium RIFCSPLOWO2_01_FULL_39_12b TaxID=1798388 RepID=A0A1F6ANZ7_9BACT|nr:MAG: hypothetical protein A2960_06045 [Candidatus Gottesmanbacteria bacterium RIFCSPLOWO2_01_FULL_39_12b]